MPEVQRETKKLPTELTARMQKAGRYEELLRIWGQIADTIDLQSDDPLCKKLDLVYGTFQKGACDSGVRAIFENLDYLEKLEAMGIPKQFLLQCVLVGALVDQLNIVSRGNFKTGQVEPQTLWLETNGWGWANEELKKLNFTEKEASSKKAEESKIQERVQKEALIAQLQANLGNSDFVMTPEQMELIRDDFRMKLMQWKAFCDRYMSEKEIQEFRLGEQGSQEITPEIYARFVDICKNNPRIKANCPPFEIIFPDSGWFYVIVKNKVNSVNRFLQAAVSNMNNWFEL